MTQNVKICCRCCKCKEIEEFRFLYAQNRRMGECRECERERSKKGRGPNRRDMAVREIAVLCKMFGTGILSDSLTYLEENNV